MAARSSKPGYREKQIPVSSLNLLACLYISVMIDDQVANFEKEMPENCGYIKKVSRCCCGLLTRAFQSVHDAGIALKGYSNVEIRKSVFNNIQNICKNILSDFKEPNLRKAGVLLVGVLVVFLVWQTLFTSLAEDYRVEFFGLVLDVIFILIIYSIMQSSIREQQSIDRQKEIVEDYKRWDCEEARFRIAGALRRLNHMRVSNFDFTGIQLSSFKFADHKIRNISNSIFYDGSWGEPFKPHDVKLNEVSFDYCHCENVQFSPFNPLEAIIKKASAYAVFVNCTFRYCELKGASFNGAYMKWTTPTVDCRFESIEYEDEHQHEAQVIFSSFEGANLDGVSFKGAFFENVDFRGAENIVTADFSNAQGLASCMFDCEALENPTLRNVSITTGG